MNRQEAADSEFPVAPRELKIELTGACNLRCQFCYLEAGDGQAAGQLPEDDVFRWIEWAVDSRLLAVRFTGGEPTLHPRLKVFCGYARLRGRFVILNTNGLAAAELYRELFPLVDDVRISLPLLDSRRLDDLTGGRHVLERKLACIQQALSAGVRRVTLLTPLLPENHGRLEAFLELAQSSPRLHWLPLRYEPTPQVPRPWTRGDAQAFAEEMAALLERYPGQTPGIILAVPFCAVSPTSLGARVFHGRARDCGPYTSLHVNARGRLQACCCVREELAEGPRAAGTLAEVRALPEFRAVCCRTRLPEECQRCPHVMRCGGGCRQSAGLVQHRGKSIDYLAGFADEIR